MSTSNINKVFDNLDTTKNTIIEAFVMVAGVKPSNPTFRDQQMFDELDELQNVLASQFVEIGKLKETQKTLTMSSELSEAFLDQLIQLNTELLDAANEIIGIRNLIVNNI